MADSVLASGTFRLLWAGEVGGRLGHQVTLFLLPLLVATALSGTATEVGAASAAQTVPAVALSLVAGFWAARVRPRRLLVATNLVRAAALAGLGAVFGTAGARLWVVLLAAVVAGSAAVAYDVGYQVVIPAVVTGEQLVPANGFVQATTSVSQLAGPAAAGFLAQTLSGSLAAVAVAGLFAVAAGVFALLPAGTGRQAVRPVRAAGRAGAAFVWRVRPLRDLCLQSALFNLHEQAFLTVFLIFGLQELGLSSGAIGAVIGLGGLGALTGALAAGSLSRRLHVGRSLPVAILLAGSALLAVPVLAALGAPAPVLGAAFAVNGAALSLYNVLAISIRQLVPPPELLGSVTAVYRLAVFGTMPVGALLGGVLADHVGRGTALWMVTGSLTATSVVLFASPLRHAATTLDVAGGRLSEVPS